MPHIVEPLVEMDATLNIRGLMAESWRLVDDMTWEFKLRQGVKFHNGEDFDAGSVRFTIEKLGAMGAEAAWSYLWKDLPQAEAVDRYTVRLKTQTPQPALIRNLVFYGMMPPGAGAQAAYDNQPIGTGPFKLSEWTQGVRLVGDAWTGYWGNTPRLARFTYRPIQDASTRVAALQTGEIDVAMNVPPDLVNALRRFPSIAVLQVPGVRLAHLPFNFRNTSSPISKLQVRQAVGYAIDGDSIIQNILVGAAQPLSGPYPSIVWASADLGGYPGRDIEKARALLTEAGHPNGVDITMIFTPGEFIKSQEVTEAIQAMLKDAGINLKIEPLEAAAYSERRGGPNWDVAINGFSVMNADPTFFMEWATADSTFGYASSTFANNRGQVVQLLGQAATTMDDEKRKALYQQAQELYWQDVPWLWGYTQTDSTGFSRKVKGMDILSTGWLRLRDAWLD